MRIAHMRATVHDVPFSLPLLEERSELIRVTVCRVETDDGYAGYGLTAYFLPFAVAVALEKEIFPLVRGMDPREVEAVHELIWWRLNPRAMTGVISSALSCLDIALWDIHGKAAGASVAKLLGGARDSAPAYFTFGAPQYDEDQLVEAARKHVSIGHRRLKMVVGMAEGGYAEDARRVRAVREGVGEGVELMIDANYGFSPVEALLLCRLVEDVNLTWFEEPLHQNDARALADLRRRTRIPIAAGQMEGHRWRLRELVERHAVDVLQPNVCWCGGYTEARKAAHLAQAFNLPIANGGGWPRFNMHLIASLMNGWRVEFHVGMAQVEEILFTNLPQPSDGVVRLPDAPGLGFEPNAENLAETLVVAE